MTPADHLHRVIFRIPSEYADPFATVLETHMDSVAWTAGEGGNNSSNHGICRRISLIKAQSLMRLLPQQTV